MKTSIVVSALAAYRLTRAITQDQITEPMRREVNTRWPESQAAYFVTCPHCVSTWAGLLVSSGVLPRKVQQGLALSAIISLGVDCAGYIRQTVSEVGSRGTIRR